MRRFPLLAAMLLSASPLVAQDTVIVRHLPSPQDTAVVVRHLTPQDTAPLVRRIPPPQYTPAPQYAPRGPMRNQQPVMIVPPKDPFMGTTLSFLFPGGGQFYAGDGGKGAALMLLGYGAPIAGILAAQSPGNRYYNQSYSGGACNRDAFGFSNNCRAGYNWGDADLGIGVGAAAWLFGIATAGTDVEHWNQAHGVRFIAAPGRYGLSIPFP